MYNIKTFVFFDIETTGLPWQEKNRTKITELSFVATLREDILKCEFGDTPPVNKLTLVFNPNKAIHPEVVKMNGLSNDLLQFAPTFDKKINTLITFIQDLPKPVCLVAHNGNVFDFKILLAELSDANSRFPEDLLCVDSLVGFRQISKDINSKPKTVQSRRQSIDRNVIADNLITDDEEKWPELNVSTEDWEDIDNTCDRLSDMSCADSTETKPTKIINNKKSEVIGRVFSKERKQKEKVSYRLSALYKRLLNREPTNCHRAEEDCMMLLLCVVTSKDVFLPWADSSCQKLNDMQPLIRH